MAKISNFFENPFNATFDAVKKQGENVGLSRAELRARELYADKPFGKEYGGICATAKVLAASAAIISFATALFALQSILFFTVGYVLSWGAAVVLCLLFEVLKTLIWKVAAKQKLRYKQAASGLIITLILLHLVSLLSSGYGAYLIPNAINPPALDSTAAPALIAKSDLSEIESIDKQIQNVDKQISDLTPYILTPSGKKSSVTAQQISTLQGQKSTLLATREKAKSTLTATREKAETVAQADVIRHQANVEITQYICIAFAVLFELIYILCTLFIFYYDYRVYIDSEAQSTPQIGAHPAAQIGAHPAQIGAHPAPEAKSTPRKIGFFNEAHQGCAPATQAATTDNDYKAVYKYDAFLGAHPAALPDNLPKNYEILIQKDSVVLARVLAKLYTKDRVNSNLSAARAKEKKQETSALTRGLFWQDVKQKIEKHEKE